MRDDLEHGWIVNSKEPDDEVFCTCEWCGGKIYYGDEYYEIGCDKFCEDCINDCRKVAE